MAFIDKIAIVHIISLLRPNGNNIVYGAVYANAYNAATDFFPHKRVSVAVVFGLGGRVGRFRVRLNHSNCIRTVISGVATVRLFATWQREHRQIRQRKRKTTITGVMFSTSVNLPVVKVTRKGLVTGVCDRPLHR